MIYFQDGYAIYFWEAIFSEPLIEHKEVFKLDLPVRRDKKTAGITIE